MGDAYNRLLAKRSGLTVEQIGPPIRGLREDDAEPELLPESSLWLVQCTCCRFPLLSRNPNDRVCPGCQGKGATGCLACQNVIS